MSMGDTDSRAEALLLDLGLRPASRAVQYLTCILPQVRSGKRPGPEVWSCVGQRYSRQPASVREAIRKEIKRAYLNDPLHFSEVMDEILFAPPQTRDFIAMAARLLSEDEGLPGR